jgi:uncharacterized protein
MSYPFYRIGRAATGLGLFAVKTIKRGGYIATYRGPRLPNDEADRREARGARYMFVINSKFSIDGSPRSNVARYINHSCWPNATPIIRGGKIVIRALRTISPGEEITYHYGEEYLAYFMEEAGGCQCAGCRIRKAARRDKRPSARKRRR